MGENKQQMLREAMHTENVLALEMYDAIRAANDEIGYGPSVGALTGIKVFAARDAINKWEAASDLVEKLSS